VGRCVTNMCTQLRHLRAAFIVYWRHKQTDDGRVVDITCILTSVRPILRIGEYSLVALQHRRIRYIGLRVSADAE